MWNLFLEPLLLKDAIAVSVMRELSPYERKAAYAAEQVAKFLRSLAIGAPAAAAGSAASAASTEAVRQSNLLRRALKSKKGLGIGLGIGAAALGLTGIKYFGQPRQKSIKGGVTMYPDLMKEAMRGFNLRRLFTPRAKLEAAKAVEDFLRSAYESHIAQQLRRLNRRNMAIGAGVGFATGLGLYKLLGDRLTGMEKAAALDMLPVDPWVEALLEEELIKEAMAEAIEDQILEDLIMQDLIEQEIFEDILANELIKEAFIPAKILAAEQFMRPISRIAEFAKANKRMLAAAGAGLAGGGLTGYLMGRRKRRRQGF